MKDAKVKGRVCAVTVTSGNRSNYAEQVIHRLIDDELISQVILVDNGSERNYQRSAIFGDRVKVIRSETNRGSSWAFAEGIEAASKSGSEFVWLLDDDNLPEDGALESLFEAFELLGSDVNNSFLSYRESRIEQVRALCTNEGARFIKDSFMGFHIRQLARKYLRPGHKANDEAQVGKISGTTDRAQLVEFEYAPFGGFLFHSSWVKRIGLPNPEFFLYGDDHEYTYRFVKNGGKILLCRASRITDLEGGWHQDPNKKNPLMDPASPDKRIYLLVRNRVWLERHVLNYGGIYLLNALGLFSIVSVRGMLTHGLSPRLFRRMKLLGSAFFDGWKGKLGGPRW